MKHLSLAVAFLLSVQTVCAAQGLAALAQQAYNDELKRFWFGSRATGHFGYLSGNDEAPFHPNDMWIEAQAVNVAYSYWKTTGNADALARLTAHWTFVNASWTLLQAQNCNVVVAQDDAAWAAMMLIELYEATADPNASAYAQGVLDCAWSRWEDATIGGGLWYDDTKTIKSSYQGTYALASYQFWQDTGNAVYHDRAVQLEAWAANALLWNGQSVTSVTTTPPAGNYSYPTAGLYWRSTQVNGSAPFGVSPDAANPFVISEGSSTVMVEAQMAYAALDARLYTETGDASYLVRLNQIATGMRTYEVVAGTTILINDMDANVNGFAGWFYARDVLPLLTHPLGGQIDRQALIDMAIAIGTKARCFDATYGASWEGACSGRWVALHGAAYLGGNQVVSSQGANMIIAGYYALLH